MNLNASINVRVAQKVKSNAEQVLSELGLTMSEAVNIYLRQIALKGGIPFDISLPNRKTVRAMRDVRQKRNLESFSSIESLEQGLNS